MTTSTPTPDLQSAHEEPKGPLIKLSEAPYAPIRWLGDEEFWKNVAVNVYSTAIVAVITVTLVSIAQMVKEARYDDIVLPIGAGLFALIAPPLLILFSYGIHQRKKLPEKDRMLTIAIFALNIALSLVSVCVVIVYGIQNIISG